MTRILYAEDDALTRENFTAMLEGHGYEVVAVADGDEAWTRYRQGTWDALLLDIHMPGKTGRELIRLVRERDALLPIIVFSEEHCCDVLTEGADDFLDKGAPPGDLKIRLDKAMERAARGNRTLFHLSPLSTFDAVTARLTVGDTVHHVGTTVGRLLALFCRRVNEPLPVKTLCLHLWDLHTTLKEIELRAYVSRLRKYFRDDPSILLKKEHGGGYFLAILPSDSASSPR